MKVTTKDERILTYLTVNFTLEGESEVQAFKNLLSWAEQGLFRDATKPDRFFHEFEVLKQLQITIKPQTT